jgi:hypothetical protein
VPAAQPQLLKAHLNTNGAHLISPLDYFRLLLPTDFLPQQFITATNNSARQVEKDWVDVDMLEYLMCEFLVWIGDWPVLSMHNFSYRSHFLASW